jgi:hypothetical protein
VVFLLSRRLGPASMQIKVRRVSVYGRFCGGERRVSGEERNSRRRLKMRRGAVWRGDVPLAVRNRRYILYLFNHCPFLCLLALGLIDILDEVLPRLLGEERTHSSCQKLRDVSMGDSQIRFLGITSRSGAISVWKEDRGCLSGRGRRRRSEEVHAKSTGSMSAAGEGNHQRNKG